MEWVRNAPHFTIYDIRFVFQDGTVKSEVYWKGVSHMACSHAKCLYSSFCAYKMLCFDRRCYNISAGFLMCMGFLLFL